jgi:tetratricopeptide (TPR) repeat protein
VAHVYGRRPQLLGPTARQLSAATMTRTTVLTALMSASVVALALYLSAGATQRIPAIEERASSAGVGNAAVDVESWPICTTMGALTDGPAWAPLDPDFAAGKQALAVNDWNGAIRALGSAALRDTRNADIQNYLGYAYRRLRQLEPAFRHYRLALVLNPRHRSAHEHLGEASLLIGNLSQAEEHLAALEQICLIPCEEYNDLKRAITEYRKFVMR